jgi:hypothetical protein
VAALLCGIAAISHRRITATPDTQVEAALSRAEAPAEVARASFALASADSRIIVLPEPDVGMALPELNATALLPASPALRPEPARRPSLVEGADECLMTQDCIDEYLFAVYERARKVDTIKVTEQIKMTVKKKGKTRTVTKTISKLVDEDFGWKDPQAAEKFGLSVIEYVIGGMDRSFKMQLYSMLHALDEAGLEPGITSGFRDDYRQSIATGHKAASDSSYHGGSKRGGYGHGLAADIVSTRGATRAERMVSSEILWKWVDQHGQDFGIGRPYLDRDPPHVGPIEGKEYADKRGLKRAQLEEFDPGSE